MGIDSPQNKKKTTITSNSETRRSKTFSMMKIWLHKVLSTLLMKYDREKALVTDPASAITPLQINSIDITWADMLLSMEHGAAIERS